MVGACVECRGPLSEWAGPLAVWLVENEVSAERSVRTVRTFARFSSWMSARGLDSADLSEDVIDEYIAAEQERLGSWVPAALQYLPLVKPSSMSFDPRRDEYTICTAIAPEAVLTVRTYATARAYEHD